MPATVELVLAVDATAAGAWMAGPAAKAGRASAAGPAHAPRGRRAALKPREQASTCAVTAAASSDIADTLAHAISRMPGVALLRGAEWSTLRVFAEPKGGRRVLLSIRADGARHVIARDVRELSPGVWRCETVRDAMLGEHERASLELDGAESATLSAQLGTPHKLAPSPALSMRRSVWRWTGPDGAVVDIELHDGSLAPAERGAVQARPSVARIGAPQAALRSELPERRCGAKPICELRLSAPIVEPGTTADAGHSGSSLSMGQGRRAAAEPLANRAENSPDRSDTRAAPDPTLAAVQAVFAAARALGDTLPVFPALIDGFTRACADTLARRDPPVRAGHTELSNASHPHDALIALGSAIARHWFGNEAGARDSADPEYVHQMRVASRRLKTLLKTFPRWADTPWRRTILPDLDWLGELLGRARDLDVFVDGALASLASADVDAGAWSALQARAMASRDRARAHVREALCTRRYASLSLAWLEWLVMQRFSLGPRAMIDKPLADYAAKRVRKHYARLIEKPSLSELTPIERHRRRIEAKRLRYTLEFFASLASRKTRRKVSKQLGRIQSVLGDGSDMTSALRFLEALDVPPYQHGFARGWCEAVLRWSAAEGERLLRELPKPKIVRTD
jgi:CHAD domain-containing protein